MSKPQGYDGPWCDEVEDLGGGKPLDFDDPSAVLESAAQALHTLALQHTAGERSDRLLILSGFLRGTAARLRR